MCVCVHMYVHPCRQNTLGIWVIFQHLQGLVGKALAYVTSRVQSIKHGKLEWSHFWLEYVRVI